MFNIGFSEFLVIGVVALIVIGPKQLPEVARVVGRLLSELKRATQDLSGGLLEVTNEVKSSINETKQGIVNEGHKIMDSVTNIEDPHHEHHEEGHHNEDHHLTEEQRDHDDHQQEQETDELVEQESENKDHGKT